MIKDCLGKTMDIKLGGTLGSPRELSKIPVPRLHSQPIKSESLGMNPSINIFLMLSG
jgi:hypothetical protein